jgi:hypothetical protein
MIRYRYQAYTADGQLVVDTVSAESEGEAVRQLMAEGLTPFEIAPASLAADAAGRGGAPRQSGRVLSSFFRNLSAMQEGGLPLDEALKLLSEDGESRAGQKLAGDLRRSVLAGESLGQAMASLKMAVPDYVLGLVRAGEEGGDLVQVLQRVASTLENQSRLADAVRTAGCGSILPDNAAPVKNRGRGVLVSGSSDGFAGPAAGPQHSRCAAVRGQAPPGIPWGGAARGHLAQVGRRQCGDQDPSPGHPRPGNGIDHLGASRGVVNTEGASDGLEMLAAHRARVFSNDVHQ